MDNEGKLLLLFFLICVAYYAYSQNNKTKSEAESEKEKYTNTSDAGSTPAPVIKDKHEQEQENKLLKQLQKQSKKNNKEENLCEMPNVEANKNLDKFFEHSGQSGSGNDKFTSHDDNENKFAAYKPNLNKNSAEDDENNKYKAGDFLPKGENKEWFDDPCPVKNQHMILVHKNIGIDSSCSHRNRNQDLHRANIPIPKKIVAPFMNSSIDPDTCAKGLA